MSQIEDILRAQIQALALENVGFKVERDVAVEKWNLAVRSFRDEGDAYADLATRHLKLREAARVALSGDPAAMAALSALLEVPTA